MQEKALSARGSNTKPEHVPNGNVEVSHDEIARLAYALWEAPFAGHGGAEQDWFEAERQLSTKAKVQAAQDDYLRWKSGV